MCSAPDLERVLTKARKRKGEALVAGEAPVTEEASTQEQEQAYDPITTDKTSSQGNNPITAEDVFGTTGSDTPPKFGDK